MKKKKQGEGSDFSFEAAMERLERIVKDLESGSLSLEESLHSFEEGVNLVRSCRDYLEAAKQRVEVLLGEDEEGHPVVEPFEEELDEEDE